jgi:hypothetical protein
MIDGVIWASEDGGESFRKLAEGLPGNWIRHIHVVPA